MPFINFLIHRSSYGFNLFGIHVSTHKLQYRFEDVHSVYSSSIHPETCVFPTWIEYRMLDLIQWKQRSYLQSFNRTKIKYNEPVILPNAIGYGQNTEQQTNHATYFFHGRITCPRYPLNVFPVDILLVEASIVK